MKCLRRKWAVVSYCRAFPDYDTDCGVRFWTKGAAKRFATRNCRYSSLIDDSRGTRPLYVADLAENIRPRDTL